MVIGCLGTEPAGSAPAVFSAAQIIICGRKRLVKKAEIIVSDLDKLISVSEIIVSTTEMVVSAL
jgi:hypothetical protein